VSPNCWTWFFQESTCLYSQVESLKEKSTQWNRWCRKITSEPHSPCTLATIPTQQKEKTLQRTLVWYRPNTLRKSS